jgi:hypothetical protein
MKDIGDKCECEVGGGDEWIKSKVGEKVIDSK